MDPYFNNGGNSSGPKPKKIKVRVPIDIIPNRVTT